MRVRLTNLVGEDQWTYDPKTTKALPFAQIIVQHTGHPNLLGLKGVHRAAIAKEAFVQVGINV